MSTLHVRDVPEVLHRKIRSLAEERNRSLSSEVIDLLDQAVHDAEVRGKQKEVLAGIRRNRYRPKKGTPPSEELLREDRGR